MNGPTPLVASVSEALQAKDIAGWLELRCCFCECLLLRGERAVRLSPEPSDGARGQIRCRSCKRDNYVVLR